MSKILNRIFLLTLPFFLLSGTSFGSMFDGVEVEVAKEAGSEIWLVSGKASGGSASKIKSLSFTDLYADAADLSARISSVKAWASGDRELKLRRFGSGDYQADESINAFSYEINLAPPENLIVAPHVSWSKTVNAKFAPRALLKGEDLLPELGDTNFRIKFRLPEGWSISSDLPAGEGSVYEFMDRGRAVFFMGNGLRVHTKTSSGVTLQFAIVDEWQFDDSVVPGMALEIVEFYRRVFGAVPRSGIQINLMQFPGNFGNDRWRAQTQGATVTIVSSVSTYRNLAEQRLHEQLRHELFHLWIPEAVQLEGEYSWFFEGFAQYQALKAGVKVGRLTFADFLRSMSEAITITSFDRSDLPLHDLASSRWQVGPGVIAARGMTVAFHSDLVLLKQTKRKMSTDDIV
ncbi:MAG: hypothetical protein HKN33_18480, partial [Pyrinomonadaceae bacterium]|nr:hypothetical protein [Pyrinomonadaceae bacterium]